MNYNLKTINLKLIAIVLLTLSSCSKWDDFKKYTKDGEIIYAGKLDSVTISSGKLRVRVTAKIKSDPKLAKCRIYWNDFRDSAEYELTGNSGISTFDKIINIDEGVKNFLVYTYDKSGNRSVGVSVIGTSYGNAYRRRLNARPIAGIAYGSNATTISWEQMDLTTGVQFTETEYVTGGKLNIQVTPITSSTTVLSGFNYQTAKFKYRTIFKPDISCIDTFAVVSNSK